MSVIITNGQSWEQIAANFTLAPEYAPAIAIQNNMEDESITGKRFYVKIPDNWMKPEYANKEITLPSTGQLRLPNIDYPSGGPPPASIIPGVPNWALFVGLGVAVLFLVK